MELKTLIKELEERFGTAPLEVEADGCCSLDFDGVSVEIIPIESWGKILLVSTVAEMPQTSAGEIAHELLAANNGVEDASSAFSIDPETRSVCLQDLIECQVADLENFAARLLDHNAAVRQWRTRLERFVPGTPPTASSGEESFDDGIPAANWIPV